jgi:hypothetical protein
MFRSPCLVEHVSFRNLVGVSIFLLICMSTAQAQDTILKRNQEKIIAKILEVNPSEIRYKRLDYMAGPVFTLEKWQIKYILYSNGVKEDFEDFKMPSLSGNLSSGKKDLSIQPSGRIYYYQNQPISEEDMLDIAWKQPDKRVKLLVKKTEEYRVIKNCLMAGAITAGTIGVLTFFGSFSQDISATVGRSVARSSRISSREQNRADGGYVLLGALAVELVSITFKMKETRHAHLTVDLYNQSVTGN